MKPFLLAFLLMLCGSLFAHAQCATMDVEPSDPSIINKDRISYDNSVQQIIRQLNSLYGYSREYYYYDDSAAPNAYASPKDGNVYLGTSLLSRTLQGANSVAGMRYLIAHEFGHLYQFENTEESLLDDERSVRYGELQADFMAGYALARLGYINDVSYRQVLSTAWQIGDPTGSWRNTNAHGTVTERQMDTHLGVSHSNQGIATAYNWSFEYLPPPSPGPPGPPSTIDVRGAIYLQGGVTLRILNGGAVINDDEEQIGQMTGVPNTMLWRFNFTKDGYDDLIGTINGLVYPVNQPNQAVGRLVIPTRH